MTLNNPSWKITVNSNPELSDIRTYFFDTQDEVEDFARGLLVASETDFTLYQKQQGKWIEQETDPYDFFPDIDETPTPIAHTQLLPNLAPDIDPKIIWKLAEGDFDALDLIENDELRFKASSIMNRLDALAVWDAPEIEDDWLTQEDEPLHSMGAATREFVTDQQWLTDLIPEWAND